MNHHSADQPQSPMPGRLASFFISLAGGDPAVFPYLPTSEANTWVKMGMSLIVPFTVALLAGSLTIYKLSESYFSVFGGFLWAGFILLIDVLVMSQLVKTSNRRRNASSLLVGGQESAAEQVARKSKQRWIALGRLGLAILLGFLMSHTVVLTLFKNRVSQQMEVTRSEHRKDFDENNPQLTVLRQTEARIADARRIQLIEGNSDFLAAYQGFLTELRGKNDPRDSGGGDTSKPTSEQEGRLRKLQADLMTMKAKHAAESKVLNDQKAEAVKQVGMYGRDLKTAADMLIFEKNGTKPKGDAFHFEIPEFATALVLESSIPGVGPRYRQKEAFVKDMSAKYANLQSEAARLDREFKTLLEQQTKEAKELAGQIDLAETAWTARQKEAVTQGSDRRISLAKDGRTELQGILTGLVKQQEKAAADYQRKVNTVETTSHDLWEESEALFDLWLGHNQGSTLGRQCFLIGVNVMVMAAILLLDLLPLTSKLLRVAGPYEDHLALASAVKTTGPVKPPVGPTIVLKHGPPGAMPKAPSTKVI